MGNENENALNEESNGQETDNFEVFTEEPFITEGRKGGSSEGGETSSDKEESQKKPEAELTKDGDADTDESGGDDDKARHQGGKRVRRYEKRIAKLTKRSKENGERAEKAERELAELRAKLDQQEAESDRPKRDDYTTTEAFEKAEKSWNEAQAGKKPVKKESKPVVDEEYEDALADVMGAFEDGKDRFDDFDKLVQAEDLTITTSMVIALAETEDPTAIAYHLASNKEETAKIAKLSPIKQAREIGKIEARLEADSNATEKDEEPKKASSEKSVNKQSKAPEPINPLRGTDAGEKDLEDMSFKEYEQHRQAQTKGRGKFW